MWQKVYRNKSHDERHCDVKRNGAWGRMNAGIEGDGDEKQAGSDGHGNELTKKHVGVRVPDVSSTAYRYV